MDAFEQEIRSAVPSISAGVSTYFIRAFKLAVKLTNFTPPPSSKYRFQLLIMLYHLNRFNMGPFTEPLVVEWSIRDSFLSLDGPDTRHGVVFTVSAEKKKEEFSFELRQSVSCGSGFELSRLGEGETSPRCCVRCSRGYDGGRARGQKAHVDPWRWQLRSAATIRSCNPRHKRNFRRQQPRGTDQHRSGRPCCLFRIVSN